MFLWENQLIPDILCRCATPLRWYQFPDKDLKYILYIRGENEIIISFWENPSLFQFLSVPYFTFLPILWPKSTSFHLAVFQRFPFFPRVVILFCHMSSMGMETLLPEVEEEMQACWTWRWCAFLRTFELHLELNVLIVFFSMANWYLQHPATWHYCKCNYSLSVGLTNEPLHSPWSRKGKKGVNEEDTLIALSDVQ